MMPYDDKVYREFLTNHKGKYETVLWSGRAFSLGDEDFAKNICDEHNAQIENEKPWKTNEMLLKEAKMEMPRPQSGDSKERKEFIQKTWDNASLATCEHAEGTVHFLKGENGRIDSTFNEVERKAIIKNEAVHDVDVISIDRKMEIYLDKGVSKISLSHSTCDKNNLPFTSPLSSKEITPDLMHGADPPQKEIIDNINKIWQERTEIENQLSDAFDELRANIKKENIQPLVDKIHSLENLKDQNLEKYKSIIKEIENRSDKQEILDSVKHLQKFNRTH